MQIKFSDIKFLKVVFVLVLISSSSCNKVEEIIEDNSTKLSKKTWTFDSISGYDTITNQFAESIFNGMTYDFDPDGSYTAVILSQSENGSWRLDNNMSTIVLNPGTADEARWQIITLNADELIVTLQDSDALTGEVTITFV